MFSSDNQEDSLIFNRTAIERGKFRGMYLKKYLVQVQKNQTTFQDDLLIKPDPNKTSNMKNSNVNKLNEKGYAPEETILNNGDVIFGKVTQVTDPNAKKPYRDSSEIYKMHTPGVVDRTYIDIPNADGYLTREALIRCEKYPRIGDKYCFPESANVEVLTTDGWINVKNVTQKHKVATLVNDTHISYEHPTELYEFDHDGDIYKLRSQQVDIDCTMNHKLYVKRRDQEKYELIEARDIMGKRFNLKKNCENINPDVPTFDLVKDKSFDMNNWLKFFGLWIAEGWANTYAEYNYQTTICQCKPRVQQIIKDVITTMGYTYSIHDKNSKITISDKNLADYMQKLSVGAPFKRLPNWVWNLSQNQSRILFEHMRLGDGCMSGGTKGSDSYRNSACYYTSSVGLADDVMRLAIHCGWSGNKTIAKPAGSITYIKGRKITSKYDNYCIKIIKAKNEPQVNHGHCKTQIGQSEEIYHYKGNIYCLEIPSHIMMIRQNGKGVWISNSSRHGQKGTIGIQLDQIDMPFTKDGIVPDLIVNPNAIPSRMTIGQLVEGLVGKCAAIQGMDADGTVFEEHDFESAKDTLEKLGYDRNGYEYMYNGMTGEKMLTKIFLCPTFYQRLKHLVEDKIHSRSRGAVTALTRQATEGRSREGGLRLGKLPSCPSDYCKIIASLYAKYKRHGQIAGNIRNI